MTELSDSELLYASPEDWDFYNKCIEGLPMISDKDGVRLGKDGEPVPYGSGPHNLKWFKQAIEIAQCSRILEIGLNVGYSAAMMYNLLPEEFKGVNHITSIDISDRHETFTAARILLEKYGPHFDFIHSDSKKVYPFIEGRYYDMCFVDGGHEEPDVTGDIELCKQLKIPYLLFDDIMPRFGPGVVPAIEKFHELELVKDMNNLRLYKWAAK